MYLKHIKIISNVIKNNFIKAIVTRYIMCIILPNYRFFIIDNKAINNKVFGADTFITTTSGCACLLGYLLHTKYMLTKGSRKKQDHLGLYPLTPWYSGAENN